MNISKRSKVLFLLSLVVIVSLVAWFTIRYLSTPKLELISLLPEGLLGYISAKNLDDIISAVEQTPFGEQLKDMPIVKTVQANKTWREFQYQKRVWEYYMQGRLDRKVLRDFAGQEAILSFYNRNGLAFLFISKTSSSAKLQVSASEVQDVIDAQYKMVRNKYRGIEAITVVGFPEEFTYAFIGKIGMLSIDKTLIHDVIDIYKHQKTGFIKRDSTPSIRGSSSQLFRSLVEEKYTYSNSSLYFDLSQYPEHLPFGATFKNLANSVPAWFFNNRYGDGKVISEHHFVLSNTYNSDSKRNRQIISMAPTDSALLLVSSQVRPETIWNICQTMFGVEILSHSQGNLSKYLERHACFIMLGSSDKEKRIIPSMAFLIPVKDRQTVGGKMLQLRDGIRINGKKLKFTGIEVHKGVRIHRAELPLGFIFAIRGGYAIIGEYLVIGTTLSILQQIIDTTLGQQKSLNPADYQVSVNSEDTGYLFIQPPKLIPEIRRIASFYAVLAGISKNLQSSRIATQISPNLSPFGALGNIGARLDIRENRGNIEVTIFSDAKSL